MPPGLPSRTETIPSTEPVPTVVVLPHPDQVGLVHLALALADRRGRSIRAHSFERPQGNLSLQHQIALRGLAPRTPADRAVRNLVQSASRGERVEILGLPTETDDAYRTAVQGIHAIGKDCILLLGWDPGPQRPSIEALRLLALGHPGPVLIAPRGGGRSFQSALCITLTGRAKPDERGLDLVSSTLDSAYPVWRKRAAAHDIADLFSQKDDDVLVVLAAGDVLDLTLSDNTPVWERCPGETAVLLPKGKERGPVLDWLAGCSGED